MARFIYIVHHEHVGLEEIGDSVKRHRFEELEQLLRQQVRSIHCTKHFQEPVFVLDGSLDAVSLSGIGGCCKEFTSAVKGLVEMAGLAVDDDLSLSASKGPYMTYSGEL
jgi:hypothetical protein